IENRVAVKRTELAAGVAANAERVFAADIEWQVSLQRVLVGRKKANHAAEMVVMTVTENERVKRRRIDLQDRHIVEQNFRRIAEIYKHVALLAAAMRLRVHGEAPLAVERGARRGVRRGVAANAPLDRDA